MLSTFLLLVLATPGSAAPGGAPQAVAADEQERCPYMFDRHRKLWLHASQIPRYTYYRVLEPGDGTRRSSLMARIALDDDTQQEVTFEVVTRIEEGTSSIRVVLTRTIADERSGLDLSSPERIALTATRGEDEEPLRCALVASERTTGGGWIHETTTFEPDLIGAVAIVDAEALEVTGPGSGWKPVLDETDRNALRYFLWNHAPGARAELEASEKRRAEAGGARVPR